MTRRNLQRRQPYREPASRILILSEGKETERIYLEGLRGALRIPSLVFEGPCGSPSKIVERGIRLRREYDEVWCVFDYDSRADIGDTIAAAEAAGLGVASSNPCFEVFLLLHYALYTRQCNASEAQRELRKHIRDYNKTFEFEAVWQRYEKALQNNERLKELHRVQGTTGQPPATELFRLIERLKTVAKKFHNRRSKNQSGRRG